jgi:hypothetical protein
MHRVGTLSIWFDRAGKSSGSHFLELVANLFSVPCFKLSHFLFKLTYTIQRRELCDGPGCLDSFRGGTS